MKLNIGAGLFEFNNFNVIVLSPLMSFSYLESFNYLSNQTYNSVSEGIFYIFINTIRGLAIFVKDREFKLFGRQLK